MAPDWSSLLWLLLVLAAIPAALWLLKRTPLTQLQAPGVVRTVAVLPLAAGQRLVTVEVGRGDERLWLLLGVTPQGISHLHTMTPQDDAAMLPASPAMALQPLLQRLRGRGRGDDAR